MTYLDNSYKVYLKGSCLNMNYFTQRCRCSRCDITNHIFIDLNEMDKKPFADHEIKVNYMIELKMVNGKLTKQFTFGYSCPWCESYNKHETGYRGLKIN